MMNAPVGDVVHHHRIAAISTFTLACALTLPQAHAAGTRAGSVTSGTASARFGTSVGGQTRTVAFQTKIN